MAEGGRSEYGSGPNPDPEPVPTQIPIPSTDTQKMRIGLLLKTPLRKGDEWFLVDCRWFKQWKKYVGFDSWDMYNVGETSLYPGPINNSGLFLDHETPTLKENLIDELDYVLMSKKAWHKLVGWYGCLEGQQPIIRKVVEFGMFVKLCKVEVYLVELNLCENNNIENVVMRRFSKADSIDTIEKEMKSLFNIPTKMETRLWNMYISNMYEELKLDSTVQDAGLSQGQLLVIEQKNKDGSWPRQTKYLKSNMATSPNFSTSPKLSSNYSAIISSTLTSGNKNIKTSYTLKNSTSNRRLGGNKSFNKSQFQPGLCGLSNLGNTCFMNSTLQCLSNTPPLTEYFLNDQYETEINRENPLGMRGEIAETYADLVKQMWLSQCTFVALRTFKVRSRPGRRRKGLSIVAHSVANKEGSQLAG